MKLLSKLTRVFFLTCSFIFSAASFAGPGINSIVVLGDSLSDQGRWYILSFGLIPQSPYYQGRFSNGPVWVEYLAEQMGFSPNELSNFALGGTTTNFELDWWQPPYSLSWEVAEFLTDYYFSSKSDRLYIIWSGGNDYWSNRDPGHAYSVVNTIIDNINALMDQGARYFLLPNMPDMSMSPYAKSHGMAGELPAVVAAHNAYLHDRLVSLQQAHPEAVIVELNISQLMAMLASGSVPGANITNTTDSCYNGDYLGSGDVVVPGLIAASFFSAPTQADLDNPLDPSVKNLIAHSVPLKVAMAVSAQAKQERQWAAPLAGLAAVGDDVAHHCPGYFFWDAIHPTTQAHKLLGTAAAQLLQQYGFHRE